MLNDQQYTLNCEVQAATFLCGYFLDVDNWTLFLSTSILLYLNVSLREVILEFK